MGSLNNQEALHDQYRIFIAQVGEKIKVTIIIPYGEKTFVITEESKKWKVALGIILDTMKEAQCILEAIELREGTYWSHTENRLISANKFLLKEENKQVIEDLRKELWETHASTLEKQNGVLVK